MSFENDFVNCYLNEKIFYIVVKKKLPDTDEEFEVLMNHIDNFYKACELSKTKVGMIMDTRLLGLLEMKYYQKFADYFSNNKEMCQKCIIASCIISDSSLITTLVNTFLKLYQSVRPVRLEYTIDKGLEFIASHNC